MFFYPHSGWSALTLTKKSLKTKKKPRNVNPAPTEGRHFPHPIALLKIVQIITSKLYDSIRLRNFPPGVSYNCLCSLHRVNSTFLLRLSAIEYSSRWRRFHFSHQTFLIIATFPFFPPKVFLYSLLIVVNFSPKVFNCNDNNFIKIEI